MKTHGDVNHRPGVRLSAGSQTVLPTVRFSPATTVEFIAAANIACLFSIFPSRTVAKGAALGGKSCVVTHIGA